MHSKGDAMPQDHMLCAAIENSTCSVISLFINKLLFILVHLGFFVAQLEYNKSLNITSSSMI